MLEDHRISLVFHKVKLAEWRDVCVSLPSEGYHLTCTQLAQWLSAFAEKPAMPRLKCWLCHLQPLNYLGLSCLMVSCLNNEG